MADHDNHAEFARQVLRAVARLYSVHPNLVDLTSLDILSDGSSQARSALESADGTIEWLSRNGIVSGRTAKSGARTVLPDAQLTFGAYRKLLQPEGNAGGVALGQIVVRAASGGDPKEEDKIAALLLRRLS